MLLGLADFGLEPKRPLGEAAGFKDEPKRPPDEGDLDTGFGVGVVEGGIIICDVLVVELGGPGTTSREESFRGCIEKRLQMRAPSSSTESFPSSSSLCLIVSSDSLAISETISGLISYTALGQNNLGIFRTMGP